MNEKLRERRKIILKFLKELKKINRFKKIIKKY